MARFVSGLNIVLKHYSILIILSICQNSAAGKQCRPCFGLVSLDPPSPGLRLCFFTAFSMVSTYQAVPRPPECPSEGQQHK